MPIFLAFRGTPIKKMVALLQNRSMFCGLITPNLLNECSDAIGRNLVCTPTFPPCKPSIYAFYELLYDTGCLFKGKVLFTAKWVAGTGIPT
jgi:hypothetical protein